MKKYRFDIILVIIILVVAGISYLIINNIYRVPGGEVQVIVNGKITKTLSLNKNQHYKINFKNEVNVIEIKNGKVFMVEANCPDKLCKKQGEINKNGDSIICLPHKVVIKVISDEHQNIDAHTN